jgi:hypothetical protein
VRGNCSRKKSQKKLLENADTTLRQEGIEVPKGVHVKFLERTKDTFYYILPSESEELSDHELIKMAGGVGVNCSKSCNRGCF